MSDLEDDQPDFGEVDDDELPNFDDEDNDGEIIDGDGGAAGSGGGADIVLSGGEEDGEGDEEEGAVLNYDTLDTDDLLDAEG